MTWTFRPKVGEGELLSAYLTRVAFAHGAAPRAFYSLHLHDPWFWTRDIDRGVARQHHAALYTHADISKSKLMDMTLRPWVDALTPKHYSSNQPPAVVPWINAAGIYRTHRNRHALQYCPECLHDHGIVKREWRLAFVTYCATHQRPLLDACPWCDSPFVPHRSPGAMTRCGHCRKPLYRAERIASTGAHHVLAQALQAVLLPILSTATGLSAATSWVQSAVADLHALRTLASLIHTIEQWRPLRLPFVRAHDDTQPASSQLEFGRINQRVRMMANLHTVLQDWPAFMRTTASKAHITQQTFAKYPAPPGWLAQEVLRLPRGQSRKSKISQTALEHRVRQIEVKKPKNWRAHRAAMVMKAALAS